MKNSKFVLAALASTVLLSACGGSGDFAMQDATSTADLFQPVTTAAMPSTYTAANAASFQMLNDVRAAVGVGTLNQHAALDLAADRHMLYLSSNNAQGAIEAETINGTPAANFYGTTPVDRSNKAGYGADGGYAIFWTTPNLSINCPEICRMLGSFFTRAVLLAPVVDVGMARSAEGSQVYLQMGTGNSAYGQLPATLTSYPYAGQPEVPTSFAPFLEPSNPAADLSMSGYPVSVSMAAREALVSGSQNSGSNALPAAGDIVINRFKIATTSGTALPVRIYVAPGVTSTGPTVIADRSMTNYATNVFLLPIAPLAAKTTFNVDFEATVRGKVVKKSWSFTTNADALLVIDTPQVPLGG